MKKLKVLVGALLRGALLAAPGCLFGWWAWSLAPALIAVLAAMGLEVIFLSIYSFVVVAIQARRDLKRKEPLEIGEEEEVED